MALNWIVPARRVIIANDWESYKGVAHGWYNQINEHKGTLASWYAPLAGEGVDLESGIENALEAVSRWMRTYFKGVEAEGTTTESTPPSGDEDDPGVPTALGEEEVTTVVAPPLFAPRLWKGPLRVLLEPADQAAPAEGTTGETATPGALMLNEKNIAVRLTDRREVDDPEALFLPGDVLEFPIFRIMERAGVTQFQNANFNRRGSFFLGTSVCDSQDQSPGSLRLHDNMMAMRFQLILNAGRGAYYSQDPVFNPGQFADEVNHATLCDQAVYARGIIYGGTLLDPLNLIEADRGDDPLRYWLRTNQWGSGAYFPFRNSLMHFPQPHGQHRLTWAWSCSPSAKALAFYMVNHQGGSSCGWGGVNQQSWNQEPDSNPMVQRSEIDSFWYIPVTQIRDRLMNRYGVSSMRELQERAVRNMFPQGGGTRVVAGSDDEELVGEDATAMTEDGDEVLPGVEQTEEAETEPEEDQAVAAAQDWDTLLPSGEEVQIPSEYLWEQHVWSAVAINGHEYSIVCVWPHERLVAEAPTAEGPPVTSLISAYNPLTGESYFIRPEDREPEPEQVDGEPVPEPEADGEGEETETPPGGEETREPTPPTDETPAADETPTEESGCDFYLFEAAGNLYRTGLGGENYINAFFPRPFKWQRKASFCIRRTRQNRADFFYIGEEEHIRSSRRLLSIVRFREADIREIYQNPGSYRPISFYSSQDRVPPGAGSGTPIDEQVNNDWYPNRAVPFPTMEEALQHDVYLFISTVRSNMSTAVTRLNGLLSGGGRGGLSASAQAQVNALRNFRQQVTNTRTVMQNQRQAAVRTAEGRVQRLQQRLERARRPTTGAAFERAAMQQQAELDRVIADETRLERELREAEAAFQTARQGAPTFPQLSDMPGSSARDRQAEFRRRRGAWTSRRDAAQTRVSTARTAHRTARSRVRQLRGQSNERALRQARRDLDRANTAARSPVTVREAENEVYASYARKIRAVINALRSGS